MKITEHDQVVLTVDLPAEGLESGDVHRGGEAYEVEFMTLAGETLAVATVPSPRLRPVNKRDVSHVRQLASA